MFEVFFGNNWKIAFKSIYCGYKFNFVSSFMSNFFLKLDSVKLRSFLKRALLGAQTDFEVEIIR